MSRKPIQARSSVLMEAVSVDIKEQAMPVNRQRAQTPPSRLGKRIGQDEEDESAKADQPYPKSDLDQGDDTERPLGILKGQIWMAPDFDDTPSEVIEAFEGSSQCNDGS